MFNRINENEHCVPDQRVSPAMVDIYENDDALEMVMDMPGVSKGDVAIEIDENNILSVRAKRSFKEPENNIVRQFVPGNFYRAFSISDEFDREMVRAQLENGILKISISRKESAKPKKIQISL